MVRRCLAAAKLEKHLIGQIDGQTSRLNSTNFWTDGWRRAAFTTAVLSGN